MRRERRERPQAELRLGIVTGRGGERTSHRGWQTQLIFKNVILWLLTSGPMAGTNRTLCRMGHFGYGSCQEILLRRWGNTDLHPITCAVQTTSNISHVNWTFKAVCV